MAPGLPSLTTIDRRSLKEAAVQQIRAAISHGELKPGKRVTELGLAKRLGVGQATIRETLIELEHQGYIQRSGPRKTFVASLTRLDVNEHYVVRSRLEALAVELLGAAKVRQVEHSAAACRRMVKAAKAGDIEEFCAADLEFHRGLWRATGNRVLFEVLERLVPRIFALDVIRPSIFNRAKLAGIAQVHSELLRLLAEGRYRAAMALTQKSMKQAWTDDLQLPGA